MTPTGLHVWKAHRGFPSWQAAAAVLGISTAALERWAEGAETIPAWLTQRIDVADLAAIRRDMNDMLSQIKREIADHGLGTPEIIASVEAVEKMLRP